MSSNPNSSVEHSAATIVDAFQASDHPGLQDVSADSVTRRLESMVAYSVPMADAQRAVVRKFLGEFEIEVGDIPESVAPLAGFGVRRSNAFERMLISSIEAADVWCDLLVEVVDLWEPKSDTIAQVGLIGDESGVIKFVTWASADLPSLAEGETYRLRNVVTDEYEGRFSVNLNSASSIEASEEPVDASDGSIEASGTIVDIQPGSGLIKRCPTEDCTRVVQNGRCGEHGEVDGEFDLRLKAVFDDGERAVNAIFDTEATSAVTGTSLEAAKQLAMDALSSDVVFERMRDQLVGRTYVVSGPVVGSYLVVNESTEQPGASIGLGHSALAPAVSKRQPAQRVLPEEFNVATHEFTESDDDRAPRFTLLPTGEAVNRVFAVGTLIEAEDVGRDDEYWKGRIVAGSSSVFVYAGQYEAQALDVLRSAETPSYIAVVGKPRTYTSGEYTNVAIRPEAMALVDQETRDAWVEAAVADTRERLSAFVSGEAPYTDVAHAVYEGEESLDAIEDALIELGSISDGTEESAEESVSSDVSSDPEPHIAD